MNKNKRPRKLRKTASDAVHHVLNARIMNTKWQYKQDGLYFSCEIKNGYVFYGYSDGNWLYTEIVCNRGIYKYYCYNLRNRKILTYHNDYTYAPIVYTQETLPLY